MKKTKFTISFLYLFFLIACNDLGFNQNNSKDALIENLINTLNLESAKNKIKIVILNTNYCSGHDCEAYFESYKKQIEILTREQAFMRGINNYIEIESLDEIKGQIILQKRNEKAFKKIEIKI